MQVPSRGWGAACIGHLQPVGEGTLGRAQPERPVPGGTGWPKCDAIGNDCSTRDEGQRPRGSYRRRPSLAKAKPRLSNAPAPLPLATSPATENNPR